MEANLENLIDRIKSEGIEEAEEEAERKLEEAEEKARQIVESAEEEAEQIVDKAELEAEQLQESGEEALKQAHRDTILVTKEKITELLDKVFKTKIGEALDVDFLQDLIEDTVKQLGEEKEYEISLSEEERKELVESLFKESRSELDEEEIDLLPNRDVDAGFRISVKDEDVYYDLSDEGLAKYLSEFLNPAVRQVLEEQE